MDALHIIDSPVSPARDEIYSSLDCVNTPIAPRMTTRSFIVNSGIPSPPNSPPTSSRLHSDLSRHKQYSEVKHGIEVNIDNAEVIGTGLWSKVYRVSTAPSSPVRLPLTAMLTPPSTPEKSHLPSLRKVYAVKVAIQAEAVDIFANEARILAHLQESASARDYVVPCHGFALSDTALVLDYATEGTLEGLTTRLNGLDKNLATEQMQSHFSYLAADLVSGLAFLHDNKVIHADIKPANILLDTYPSSTHPDRLIARYCDFSASVLIEPIGTSSSTAPSGMIGGGGTWTFMAPEQMCSAKETNGPSYAADVWSLGMTLLSFAIGGSPFESVSENAFMMREAVKTGDPLMFAENESGAARLDMTIPVLIDQGMRLSAMSTERKSTTVREVLTFALRKKKEDRVSALEWKDWMNEFLTNTD